jgi:leucyl aminopeptidase
VLTIRLVEEAGEVRGTLAVPVFAGEESGLPDVAGLPAEARAEAAALLATAVPLATAEGAAAGSAGDPGQPGAVQVLPRPRRSPDRMLLVGVGEGDEAGWRAAGAAVARSVQGPAVTVAVPAGSPPDAVRGLAEGVWLAAYRFVAERPRGDRATEISGKVLLRRVSVAVAEPAAHEPALAAARATAAATVLARDLTNTPSSRKSPLWFARQVQRACGDRRGLTVSVRGPQELAAEGFGGLLAVGGGSANPPRLVELAWRPRGARTHVVLVGKGITFDTGGLSIKSVDGMKLMRKDMAGAAAVVAATLGAAALELPVRVTALAPMAENMVSGSAYRPGDVIRHYGGITTESTNSDAEGRLVLADALAYAVRRLKPDFLVDLATLTGANAVALGRRTAALYSENDELAAALDGAARAAGEQTWRMPLAGDYVEYLGSEIADLHSSPDHGAGSVVAALFLREFVGPMRGRWAHVDMSAPSWIDAADAELAPGATGWGVRTLLRWLGRL